jgi:hypothetical protein
MTCVSSHDLFGLCPDNSRTLHAANGRDGIISGLECISARDVAVFSCSSSLQCCGCFSVALDGSLESFSHLLTHLRMGTHRDLEVVMVLGL